MSNKRKPVDDPAECCTPIEVCIEAVQDAYREFERAVEGPEMCDYANDAEARRAVHDATLALMSACATLLRNIPWNMRA